MDPVDNQTPPQPTAPPPPPHNTNPIPPPPHEQAPLSNTGAAGDISKDVRTYTMLMHLSPLIVALIAMVGGLSFLGFLAPLVMWLIKKDESPYIDRHGRNATNFNITIAIAYLALFILSIITLGFGLIITVPLMIVVFIVNLVCSIKAAMEANKGGEYTYPMSLQLV